MSPLPGIELRSSGPALLHVCDTYNTCDQLNSLDGAESSTPYT